ncbi:DUF4279 domain-containing protein [Actinacidiphila glaucinigra]|uniref:DUF4279 domain-containing protein n=1 Tax=Actinacidiphila glaucinigra TaxID=235986 RepID=A0A238ZZD8_9ACTN|nr:DUF4279 domain-containing protein [Actinacidiphila glaucinigra]SNR88757.1 protein of unknown function [Actinacidiphila glaucinigra]
MPVRQYVYFALFSRHTPAQEITEQLGISPDKVSVRGSRLAGPTVVPVDHSWEVACADPGLCVDEQIARVLERLRPHTDRIAELAGRLAAEGGGAVLQVVRYFDDATQNLPEAPQSPNLFGWHLDREVMDFLAAVGAELDVDEYDTASGPDGR